MTHLFGSLICALSPFFLSLLSSLPFAAAAAETPQSGRKEKASFDAISAQSHPSIEEAKIVFITFPKKVIKRLDFGRIE